MGATPCAAVLKVVTSLRTDLRAESRGRSGPGPATGVRLPPTFFILFLTVFKYLNMLSTTPCCRNSMPSKLAS